MSTYIIVAEVCRQSDIYIHRSWNKDAASPYGSPSEMKDDVLVLVFKHFGAWRSLKDVHCLFHSPSLSVLMRVNPPSEIPKRKSSMSER